MEQDPLNTHECMPTLMRLLDHMQHNNIYPEPPKVCSSVVHHPVVVYKGIITQGSSPAEMPSWMAALHRKLSDGSTERNVRLFVSRLITNRPKVNQL